MHRHSEIIERRMEPGRGPLGVSFGHMPITVLKVMDLISGISVRRDSRARRRSLARSPSYRCDPRRHAGDSAAHRGAPFWVTVART